ncbi:substrate-binding periplasmic protein [Andreprevotia chitinilytica]|uniref:substrate-binding periplasmic protein n=1 Tax=Andreprevotia chitinilytica TaxID=396808 RepID=UPI000558536C|nr:transporter substrate-binding domain-containing protein [Andreprevotia chitinilytica]
MSALKKLLVGLAVLSLSSVVWAGCSKPLSVVPEDWPPYSYKEGAQFTGLDIELMRAIFKEAGCSLVFEENIPRLRRHYMHKEGQLDVLFAASVTEERKQFSWFTLPYRDEVTGLFARQDNAASLSKVASFADVSAARASVLAPNAGWYGDDYAKNLGNLQAAGLIQHFENFEQGVRMLQANRADLMMGDVGAVVYASGKLKLNLVQLTLVPNRDPVHLMLSKKSTTQADVDALNAAITKLEKRGDLAKIRAKYGLR